MIVRKGKTHRLITKKYGINGYLQQDKILVKRTCFDFYNILYTCALQNANFRIGTKAYKLLRYSRISASRQDFGLNASV